MEANDLVRVKSDLVVGNTYWIIECDESHISAKWMEWTIDTVLWEEDGYILSFDHETVFGKWMLELVKGSTKEQQKEESKVSRRESVVNELKEFKEMISWLQEKDNKMFFGLLFDKLKSILYEKYWD